MMNKTAIALLSGGLDSLVSLAAARKMCEVKMALTFDYGQKAADDEIEAASEISRFYSIEHKVLKLPFLSEITNNALTRNDLSLEFEDLNNESANAVWVPNRNGLFLNIGACFCDKFGYDYIIIGANQEEAETFSDNSSDFIQKADEFFSYSTNKKPTVLAPLLALDKTEIINEGVKLDVEFRLLKSCYNSSVLSGVKHCGVCESCKRLQNAILKSLHKDLIKLFF